MTVTEPQGILLVGHTRQLAADEQRASFHRFRRNLWNPTVLTYDELLERARFLVDKAATRVEAAAAGDASVDVGQETPPVPDFSDLDDLPF